MPSRRLVCAALAAGLATPAFASRARFYAFTYFHNADDGGAGMRLAISRDGFTFSPVRGGMPMVVPHVGENKLMRDPCVARDPRTGRYHMVWTTGWTGRTIGHATSPDLVTWSAQTAIPVMAAYPDCHNCWAPELIWDDRTGRFILFWSSTVGGVGPKPRDHRIYATSTANFHDFAPTAIFYDPGYSVIDATFVRRNGRLYFLIKDERKDPLRKVIQWCEAASPTGPFGPLSPPISPAWAEGPTAIMVGDELVLFYDRYVEKTFGAVATRDMRHWYDVTPRIAIPAGANHGTMIAIPPGLYASLAALR
ncbi:glycoside hydrolase family 43 protein [Sphingomonas sp.]|uniref:glycoside hydrolase family 43 protein n=1 Tax=Sphingomonas sp. TaxID=28214 RepID=UPI002ED7EA2D